MRAFIAAFVVLAAPLPAIADEWRDPDLGTHIAEGMATENLLWLRGGNGVLVEFDRRSGERRILATDAVDIVADGPKLWLLAGTPTGRSFTIRDVRASDASPRAMNPDSSAWALIPDNGVYPDVLMAQGYLRWTDDRSRRIDFPAALDRFPLAATDARGFIYAGYNRGEWGGGLRRIDPETGSVSFVVQPGEGPCGGDLNPACEPIVGLFRDRRNPDCVIAGAGLSHLGMSFGRVYRICGTEITTIFSTPAPATPDRWMMRSQSWPLESLVETVDGWVGVSRDRYFLNRGGQVVEHPMPDFETWSGIRISQANGILFVVAACCWGSVDDPTLYSTLAIPIRRE